MVDEFSSARGAGTPQHGESGRNARARAPISVLAALALAACGSARAEVDVPPPRASLATVPSAITTPVREAEIAPAATVSGDIRFLSPPGDLDLGRVVVYLEPRTAGARAASRSAGDAAPILVASEGPAFAPPLAAVPWNRPIVLANEGPVNHRVFAADLGLERAIELVPGGRSASFRLPPVGPIRFFCSLHVDESFVLFSERTAHVAVIEGRQRFSFGPVAPGRYVLSIWSERVEGPVRDVLVDGYSRRLEPVWIDPQLVRPADALAKARR